MASGEELMFQRIVDLLQHHGHKIQLFVRNSADISNMNAGKSRSFFSGIYSTTNRSEIRNILRTFHPDLVQIQNLFPLISPSILPVIKTHNVPIVMRISNYRLVCPNGLFLSHGKLCEKCRSGREYWCVLKNCEDNILKSLGYALRNYTARKMRFYLDNVTYYYAQTEFQKKCLTDEGFPLERIGVIPNMFEQNKEQDDLGSEDYIGYAGRVSPEKGISNLLEAARICSDISFKIAGDYQRMPELISDAPDNAEFLGHLDRKALNRFYHNCRIFVLPSVCFEGFPSVLIEAMQNGIPIICSRIGGLPEIVEDGKTGMLFEPGNPNDLAKKIQHLWDKPDVRHKMGIAGRNKVLNEYSPQQYYDHLMNIYKQAFTLNRQPRLQAKM